LRPSAVIQTSLRCSPQVGEHGRLPLSNHVLVHLTSRSLLRPSGPWLPVTVMDVIGRKMKVSAVVDQKNGQSVLDSPSRLPRPARILHTASSRPDDADRTGKSNLSCNIDCDGGELGRGRRLGATGGWTGPPYLHAASSRPSPGGRAGPGPVCFSKRAA